MVNVIRGTEGKGTKRYLAGCILGRGLTSKTLIAAVKYAMEAHLFKWVLLNDIEEKDQSST